MKPAFSRPTRVLAILLVSAIVTLAALVLVPVALILAPAALVFAHRKLVGRALRGVGFVVPTIVLVLLVMVELPYWLRVVAFVSVGWILFGAVFLISAQDTRKKFFRGLTRFVGRLAPLFYTLNLVLLALAFFSFLTLFLEPGGLRHTGSAASSPITPREVLGFFLWHLVDGIPVLDVNQTIGWQVPLTYEGALVGWMLLLFNLLIIIPAIGSVRAYLSIRHEGIPRIPLSAEGLVYVRAFFGPAIDWSVVVITDSVMVLGPGDSGWACNNVIRFKRAKRAEDRHTIASLVRTLVEVWQHQSGQARLLTRYSDWIMRLFGGSMPATTEVLPELAKGFNSRTYARRLRLRLSWSIGKPNRDMSRIVEAIPSPPNMWPISGASSKRRESECGKRMSSLARSCSCSTERAEVSLMLCSRRSMN